VLGLAGYVAASLVCAVLAERWQLPLAERVVAIVVPPVAFVIVVTIATALAGRELIVFYQTTSVGAAAVIAAAAAIGADVWRVLDVSVIGYGVFLAFGRIGCFGVACCHGRPARRGVRYGDAHVALGLWPRWRDRPLVPVQLIESAASAALVVVGLALSGTPGTAAVVYAAGYSAIRFGLELVRGDPVRPYALGLSEAQWFALAVVTACAIARPAVWTIAFAAALACAAAWLVVRRAHRALGLPPHLRELDRACAEAAAAPGRRAETRLGVVVSYHPLADGRADWVLSSTHVAWSLAAARRLAAALWSGAEVQPGRGPGVVHVIVG
jgi:hypothetical protein